MGFTAPERLRRLFLVLAALALPGGVAFVFVGAHLPHGVPMSLPIEGAPVAEARSALLLYGARLVALGCASLAVSVGLRRGRRWAWHAALLLYAAWAATLVLSVAFLLGVGAAVASAALELVVAGSAWGAWRVTRAVLAGRAARRASRG